MIMLLFGINYMAKNSKLKQLKIMLTSYRTYKGASASRWVNCEREIK